jgi:hypothetical protein
MIVKVLEANEMSDAEKQAKRSIAWLYTFLLAEQGFYFRRYCTYMSSIIRVDVLPIADQVALRRFVVSMGSVDIRNEGAAGGLDLLPIAGLAQKAHRVSAPDEMAGHGECWREIAASLPIDKEKPFWDDHRCSFLSRRVTLLF